MKLSAVRPVRKQRGPADRLGFFDVVSKLRIPKVVAVFLTSFSLHSFFLHLAQSSLLAILLYFLHLKREKSLNSGRKTNIRIQKLSPLTILTLSRISPYFFETFLSLFVALALRR